jgi:hypothetical protein
MSAFTRAELTRILTYGLDGGTDPMTARDVDQGRKWCSAAVSTGLVRRCEAA